MRIARGIVTPKNVDVGAFSVVGEVVNLCAFRPALFVDLSSFQPLFLPCTVVATLSECFTSFISFPLLCFLPLVSFALLFELVQ